MSHRSSKPSGREPHFVTLMGNGRRVETAFETCLSELIKARYSALGRRKYIVRVASAARIKHLA